MHSPIVFERPLFLVLLPIAGIIFWLIARRSRAPLAKDQVRQSLIVRLIVASAIVFGLAQPTFRILTNNLTAVFVLDASDSMRPELRAEANRYIQKAIDSKGDADSAGLIVFGKYPNLEVTPTDDPVMPSSHAAVTSNATDIQAAIQAAEAAFPGGSGRKIVLLTDGKENAGFAKAEIASLKARGILVDVAPVGTTDSAAAAPDAGIDGMRLPAKVDKDAPFPIRMVITSNVPQTAKLHVRHDKQPFADETVTLKAGKNVVEMDGRETVSGTHRYDADIDPQQDTLPDNDKAFAVTEVHDRPRVLYIAGSEAGSPAAMKTALAAQGIDLDIKEPTDVPTDQAGWNAYDSLILSDVAATELTPLQHMAIRESVRTFGVGLGMIGGPDSFGAGSYDGTPVEDALPVNMAVPEKKRIPAADIVIVVDASGSMSADEDGYEKVQLAARAAVNLMKSLTPSDRVAVIAVTTEATLVVPLETPNQAALAATQVESLHAGGGGIYCHTGLVAAYTLLSSSKAPIKHVIMCADTSDSEEQEGSVDAATDAYRTHRITTTCYGIGQMTDDDVGFQQDVARAGKGDFGVVSRAADLPQLYKRDAQRLQRSLFVEKPFRPVYNAGDPVIGTVGFDTEPPLLGYNVVTPKPGVQQPLISPSEKDTVFAYWNYGLGRSFAFTSDDRAHWAVHWLTWPGYSRFWAQTVRWSLRAQYQPGLQAVADNDSGTGHIAADVYSQSGGFVNNAPVTATAIAPDQSVSQITLQQTEPGRYEANFDADQTGVYVLSVRDGSRPGVGQTVELSVPYSPEYRLAPPNLPLLTALTEGTGGRMEKTSDDVFHDGQVWTAGTIGLTPSLLVLAGLLFVLDIAWRRLGLRVKVPLPESWTRPRVSQGAESAPDAAAGERPPGSPAGSPAMSRRAEPVIDTPKRRETYEDDSHSELLRRPVSRIAGDGSDDNPFPFVASKIKRPPGRHIDDD